MINKKITKEELKGKYEKWHLKRKVKIDKLSEKYSNWILNILHTKSGKKILDVACGKGVFLYYARKRGLHTYGIDISESSIGIVKKINPDFEILVGDAENLPYSNNSFDYVTCLGSLEHFPNPTKGIREMSRVLKKNGRACIYVPNLFFIGHIYMAWRYGIEPSEAEQQFSEIFKTKRGWEEMLKKNGLRILKCYKYNTIWESKKVNLLTKIIYNFILRPFIPLNLSYAFIFICKKE
jgi:ubiquinone/menaquinone biosynthesis C-methylase UbiE